MKLVANSRRGVMINMNNKQGLCRGSVERDTDGAREPSVYSDLYVGKDRLLKVNKLRWDRIALLFNQDAYSIVSAGDLLLNCFQSELPEGKLHILAAKGHQRAKVKVLCDVFQTSS